MTTKLDDNTLEWAAEWIDGSLKGEENERVRAFGRNMAMTLRAAKIDSRASSADSVVDDDALVEALAALAHEQWSGWMRHLFERCFLTENGNKAMRSDDVDRWTRQIRSSYLELPENERESDREEARRMIEVFRALAAASTAAPPIDHLPRDAGVILIEDDNDAGARVVIRFSELRDAERLHSALLQARTTTTTPSTVDEAARKAATEIVDAVWLAAIEFNIESIVPIIAKHFAVSGSEPDKCSHGVLWSTECLTCGPSDHEAVKAKHVVGPREDAEGSNEK